MKECIVKVNNKQYDLNRIKPNNIKVSDKFSRKLYKQLKDISKEKYHNIKIYWNTSSRWDGSHMPFENVISSDGFTTLNQVMVSPDGNKRTGYFLSSIITGNKKAERFALPHTWELIDITDWFFDTYEKIGRCMYSPHNGWLAEDDGRFTYVNNTRKCNYCGEWQQRHVEKVQTIKRVSSWR